ncbi:MAG: triose-phosphate isomerase [Patescibacteria group bacterium]
MKKLIIANWKMNPTTAKEAARIMTALAKRGALFSRVELVVCPPFVFFPEVREKVDRIHGFLGAQNISDADSGLHTGEISARMVRSAGASHVILGHSERRAMGETDEIIHEKVIQALRVGLKPIVAIGESERSDDAHRVLDSQMRAILSRVPRNKARSIIFAYEPRWAISKGIHDGAGFPDLPESAHEKMIYMRRVLADLYGHLFARNARIIYGGSVRAKNIRSFLIGDPSFDGALVGGASVDPQEFLKLVQAL